MSYQGRSLDDLPLAAYSRGSVEDEPEPEIEQPHLSQQDAVALAMGIDVAPKAEPDAAAHAPSGDPGPSLPSLPRFSPPRFSLPRFSLPKLPRVGLPRRSTVAAESPFQVTAQPAMAQSAMAQPAMAQSAMAQPAIAPAPMSRPAMTVAHAPSASPRTGGQPRVRLPKLGDLGTTLRNPRAAVRDPRVLFGGMIGVGAVLLGASLFGGGSGGVGPGASPTAPTGPVATAAPGAATVQVWGGVEAVYTLTGSSGFGRPADGALVSTWSDAFSGTAMSITGRVGSGTRTTSPDLILSVTVLVDGAPVTFVSQAGECTIGMAEKVFSVTGSFVCPQVTSADGGVKLKITGTYQT